MLDWHAEASKPFMSSFNRQESELRFCSEEIYILVRFEILLLSLHYLFLL